MGFNNGGPGSILGAWYPYRGYYIKAAAKQRSALLRSRALIMVAGIGTYTLVIRNIKSRNRREAVEKLKQRQLPE